jgi:CRISPR/Cas system-associated exonuclease Cas4 (RecB family)
MSLPFNAEVTPDPETKTRLIDNLNILYNKPRSEIHVSDLCYCLRQTIFRKISPRSNSEKELGYYSSGQAIHFVLEGLHGAEREVEREFEGVKATIDLLDDVPLEIKSTRSFKRDIKSHWVRQLAYYAVIEGKSEGKLIIMYLFPRQPTKKSPDASPGMFETYNVSLPDATRVLHEFRERRDTLQKGLDAKDPSLVPGVRGDPEMGWLCQNCQYRGECETLEVSTQ